MTAHRCINFRASDGGLYAWEFERRDRKQNVRVDAPLAFNTAPPIVDAALAGLGIAFLLDDELLPYIKEGLLVRVLEDWCLPFAGYHLYYPSRRQSSPAFKLVVDALRILLFAAIEWLL